MNQIARGGYSPTPPEEDTGVPHASRSQGPDPSLQLEPPASIKSIISTPAMREAGLLSA